MNKLSYILRNHLQFDDLIGKITDGLGSQTDYINFIKKYISLHYMDEISLNEVAEILNLSRSYLSTLFKNEVGISFTEYLINFRLNRAIEILKLEKLPLNTIAEMVGYPDYTQFSKIFKKYKGVSPKNYLTSFSRCLDTR